MIDNCTAVILAGGQSKRMGQDKASLMFEGQTLLARAEQRLTSLFEHVVVSVREQRSDTNLPQVLDDGESRAPMLGIVAAMQTVKTDWLFVVGVDMPFVSPDLLCFMAEQRSKHDAVAVFTDGMLQPLCCFYAKPCLAQMQTNIDAGKRSLKHLLQEVDTFLITATQAQRLDTKLHSFVSLDTISAVQQAAVEKYQTN